MKAVQSVPQAVKPQKPPQPNTLSFTELCQFFIDHHCTGNTELARPFLVELIKRDRYQRALQVIVKGVRS